jgi:hypothetical protein
VEQDMLRAVQRFGVRHPQPELFHYLFSAVSPILVVIQLLTYHHEYIYISYVSDFRPNMLLWGRFYDNIGV